MIRLIVSDVDGTLVREGGSLLDPHLFDCILELKKRGIRFVAASGRQYESIRNLFRPVRDDVIFIADNGSFIIDRDEVLSASIFAGDAWKQIARHIMQVPQAHVMISALEGTYTLSRDPQFLALLEDGYGVTMQYCPDIPDRELHVSKVAVYNTSSDPFLLAEKGRQIFGDMAYIVASGSSWVDFMAPEANKGAAVRKLQCLLGVTADETMAFGDNHNDIGLLQAAGDSYAVASAPQQLKAAADHVLDGGPEEKAVLRILEQVIRRRPDL